MCSPEAWTGAAMGMLKSGAENAAAMANWRYRKDLEELGTKSALESMRTQQRQAATRQMQERMSRGQEIAMIAKKAAAIKAAATVRAGKAGVAGESVVALTQGFERDALESIGVRKVEADWADAMAEQNKEAIRQQAQSRIEAVQAPPEPSSAGRFMNTLSQMATGAIQAHQMKSGIEAADPVAPEGYVPTFKTPLGDVPQNFLQAPLDELYTSVPKGFPSFDPVANIASTPSASMFPHLQSPVDVPLPRGNFLGIRTIGNFADDGLFNPYNLGNWEAYSPFGTFQFRDLQIGGNR